MIRRLLLYITYALVLTLLGGLWWLTGEAIPRGHQVTCILNKGDRIGRAAQVLIENHVNIQPTLFRWMARLKGDSGRLKAGQHILRGPISRWELSEKLTQIPKDIEVVITFKEGLTRWHIADLLSEAKVVDRAEFLREVERQDAEGELFPDTYRFTLNTPVGVVVKRLRDRFKAVFQQVVQGHPQEKDLLSQSQTRAELINLASFVERESALPAERPLIARVFYNRLKIGMKLQSDPSCVYSSSLYKQKPSPRVCHDLNSRYSTYTIQGLPPTPIANPGRGALTAALYPDVGKEASTYLFFVAKQDGTRAHFFSESYQSHKAAVKKYLINPQLIKPTSDEQGEKE